MAKNKTKSNHYHPNFWGFLRDILIHAMNKGVMIPLGVMILSAIMLARTPEKELVNLQFALIDGMKNATLLPWLVVIVLIALWHKHIHWLRSEFFREMERVGKEKSMLQGLLIGKEKVTSSDVLPARRPLKAEKGDES